MKVVVKVKTRARETLVEQTGEGHFLVSVKEPPIEGKANEAVIKALAEYFHLPPSNISILSRHTSRHKVLNVVAKPSNRG